MSSGKNIKSNTNRQRRLKRMKQQKTIKTFCFAMVGLLLVALLIAASFLFPNTTLQGQDNPSAAPPTTMNNITDPPNTVPTPSGTIDDTSVQATPVCTPAANFNDLIRNGDTIGTRFAVPNGWERTSVQAGSFAEYLRNQRLRPDGTSLLYWDGKNHAVPAHAAVLDRPTPSRYEQCADTVIHLYSDYLFYSGQYDKIVFTFNNGFVCDFMHFAQGYRPNANKDGWETGSDHWTGTTERVYNVYLQEVFIYANTASLYTYDLKTVSKSDLSIGDMFIVPGFPGHVVIVADMMVNKTTGEKRFITVQGSMPAVQSHVMMNAEEPGFSPWQNTKFDNDVFCSATYWTCPVENICRFK